jgi:hypothetical protein
MSEATALLDPGSAAPAASSPAAAPTVAADPATPAAAPAADPAGGDASWRKLLAGEDEKSLKDLERFSDPGSLLKAFKDTQTALRNKTDGMVKLPGEGATDEDKQAFAKAIGIPDAPDKYQITVKPPEGLEVGEADKAFLSKAVAKLHASGGLAASPQVANIAHEIYYDFMQEQAAMMAASAVVKAREAEATLRKEWGAEYETNLGLANEALKAYGDKEVAGLLEKQFADGTTLGAHPGIIRMLSNAARNGVEDVNFLKSIVNAPGMGPSAIDEEMSQIKKWRTGTPDEQRRYAEAQQPNGRLEQLMAMKQRVSGTQ